MLKVNWFTGRFFFCAAASRARPPALIVRSVGGTARLGGGVTRARSARLRGVICRLLNLTAAS
jgi:hypothetical protein